MPVYSAPFLNKNNLNIITPLVQDVSIQSEFLLNDNGYYFRSLYIENLTEFAKVKGKFRKNYIDKIFQTIEIIHVKKCKDLSISVFSLSKELKRFKGLIKNSKILQSLSNHYDESFEWSTNFTKSYPELVLSHNDLVSGNLLFSKLLKLYVIDFDMSSLNHPLFDYVSFLSENKFSRQESKYIINNIENMFPSLKTHIKHMKKYQDVLWSYWAMYYYEQTGRDLYLNILNSKLESLNITSFDRF